MAKQATPGSTFRITAEGTWGEFAVPMDNKSSESEAWEKYVDYQSSGYGVKLFITEPCKTERLFSECYTQHDV